MNVFSWSPEAQCFLEEMARDGLTGGQIAKALGITRNAVLGRCHRTGVKLPLTPEKLERCHQPAKSRAPAPPRNPRPRGRRYTNTEIAAALAARLAGASRSKAALFADCSPAVIRRWERKPVLVALGRELFERARADAANKAAMRTLVERTHEAARSARNERALEQIKSPRVAFAAREYLNGRRTSAICAELNVSRQRISQMLAQAAGYGVDFGGKLRSAPKPPSIQAWERPEEKARKRLAALALEQLVRRDFGLARGIGHGFA